MSPISTPQDRQGSRLSRGLQVDHLTSARGTAANEACACNTRATGVAAARRMDKVLVVDDEPESVGLIEMVLDDRDMDIITAGDGVLALSLPGSSLGRRVRRRSRANRLAA